MPPTKGQRRNDVLRFAKFVPIGADGCWNWRGGHNSSGRAMFWFAGSTAPAARVAYRFFNGPIADGLCVCHHCDNPSCVRPDHLFLGSTADNVADRVRKGRSKGGRPKTNPTHCPQGHAYDEQNTYLYDGVKMCRRCFRERAARRREEKRRCLLANG